MKVQIVGLGQFGLFLAEHFLQVGSVVFGTDIDESKRAVLEKLGGIWGVFPSDITILAVFPSQIQSISDMNSLIVNMSSVQEPGLQRLGVLGVDLERIMSIHPLFGPIGVCKSGWVGKQLIVTKNPCDPRSVWLLETFFKKGVCIEYMSPEDHDEKMVSHALAFFVSELIGVGAEGVDCRYLTGSASHMLGLLEFTNKSDDLRCLILSNPAFKKRWPAIFGAIQKLSLEFGWKV